MGKRLHVGNLPYSVSQNILTDLFSQAGKVESVNLIIDRETGRSKGFGFVEMTTDEEAKKAIKMFDGYKIDDRSIAVNEARPKKIEPSGFGKKFF